jgi:putative oxidoreductase
VSHERIDSMNVGDLGVLVVRVALGVVFIAHGYNHVFGGGRIRGTARWFETLGMRPGILHAWTASLTELAAGVLLCLGLGTPLACAGIVGTMLVAWATNHRRNGFFIFRPGEGYEYVMTLTLVGVGVACIGAGRYSLDHALGWFTPPGWLGVGVVAVLGVGGAAALLGLCWRPRTDQPG